MALEETLTSRDEINAQLRGVLDEATGKWGIRVNRVELKAIDPPASIQESMEKQMRAEREKRAAILTAEGVKQSQILTAEGEKQAAILRAEGERAGDDPRGRGPGEGDRDGLRRDPRGRPRPEAARLPVPAGAAADRAGRGEQGLDHPGRVPARARTDRQPGRQQGGLGASAPRDLIGTIALAELGLVRRAGPEIAESRVGDSRPDGRVHAGTGVSPGRRRPKAA